MNGREEEEEAVFRPITCEQVNVWASMASGVVTLHFIFAQQVLIRQYRNFTD